MQRNYAAIPKLLKTEKRERRRMPKCRAIDETPLNPNTFLDRLQLESRVPQGDVPGGNERPRPCRCDSSLFMTATPSEQGAFAGMQDHYSVVVKRSSSFRTQGKSEIASLVRHTLFLHFPVLLERSFPR
jgi:hypothetical protein